MVIFLNINIPINFDNKTELYKSFNQKRLEIKAVIEKSINSIYNLNNTNFASENKAIPLNSSNASIKPLLSWSQITNALSIALNIC